MVHSEEHRVASWTEAEYKAAIQDTEFYDQVKDNLGPGKDKEQQLLSKLYTWDTQLASRFNFQSMKSKEKCPEASRY